MYYLVIERNGQRISKKYSSASDAMAAHPSLKITDEGWESGGKNRPFGYDSETEIGVYRFSTPEDMEGAADVAEDSYSAGFNAGRNFAGRYTSGAHC